MHCQFLRGGATYFEEHNEVAGAQSFVGDIYDHIPSVPHFVGSNDTPSHTFDDGFPLSLVCNDHAIAGHGPYSYPEEADVLMRTASGSGVAVDSQPTSIPAEANLITETSDKTFVHSYARNEARGSTSQPNPMHLPGSIQFSEILTDTTYLSSTSSDRKKLVVPCHRCRYHKKKCVKIEDTSICERCKSYFGRNDLAMSRCETKEEFERKCFKS